MSLRPSDLAFLDEQEGISPEHLFLRKLQFPDLSRCMELSGICLPVAYHEGGYREDFISRYTICVPLWGSTRLLKFELKMS